MEDPTPCIYRDPALSKGRVPHSMAPMRPTVTSIPHQEPQPYAYYPSRVRSFKPFHVDGSSPVAPDRRSAVTPSSQTFLRVFSRHRERPHVRWT